MGFREWLLAVERRWSWGVLGAVLGVGGLALAIYTTWFLDRRAEIQIQIVGNSSVFEVRTEVTGDLRVLYDGTDITAQKLDLRIVKARLSNVGQEDVLLEHFDKRDPLGFSVSIGNIIRVDALGASSPYLAKNATPTIVANQQVVVAPVILPPGAWIDLQALVVHPKGENPRIAPVGSIARTKSIGVVPLAEEPRRPSVWDEITAGPWYRALGIIVAEVFSRAASVFLAVLMIVCVFVPIAFVADAASRLSRRRLARQYRERSTTELGASGNFLLDGFVENSDPFVRGVLAVAESKEAFTEFVDQARLREERDREREARQASPRVEPKWTGLGASPQELVEVGLVKQTDKGLEVDEGAAARARDFAAFLVNRGRKI